MISHSFSHLFQDPLETALEAQIRELSESVSTWCVISCPFRLNNYDIIFTSTIFFCIYNNNNLLLIISKKCIVRRSNVVMETAIIRGKWRREIQLERFGRNWDDLLSINKSLTNRRFYLRKMDFIFRKVVAVFQGVLNVILASAFAFVVALLCKFDLEE